MFSAIIKWFNRGGEVKFKEEEFSDEEIAVQNSYKFILKRSVKNHKYYFSIVAGNNKIVAHSQGYKTKFGAMKTIEQLRERLSSAETEMKE